MRLSRTASACRQMVSSKALLRPTPCILQKAQTQKQTTRLYSAAAYEVSDSIGSTAFNLPLLLDPDDSLLSERGIPGLFSPAGCKVAWFDWHSYLIDGLNKRVPEAQPGSTAQLNRIRNLIRAHARSPDPSSPAIFNYASSAWNNEFFFRGLNFGFADETNKIPPKLTQLLELDFFSVSNLRAEFLAHAASMFSGGFVWLVRHTRTSRSPSRTSAAPGHNPFSILRTYSSGSPLPEAHFRAQLTEQRAFDSVLGGDGSKSKALAKDIAEQASLDVWPVLGVSVWEHSYITDYGVRGRDEYLERWWDTINWKEVAKQADFEELERPKTERNRLVALSEFHTR